MPSIGPVTAAAFVAALEDAHRFAGPHQVEAYLGLVLSEMSSGEKQRKGAITKSGSGRTRTLMVQAAVGMLRVKKREATALRTWAERIALRRGKKVAVVALARRLTGILYAMMRDGTTFKPALMPKEVERQAAA